MSSARRNISDAPINEYEKQKLANMARNKRRLESLNLPKMNTMLQPRKRTKATHNTSDVVAEGHNLRSRQQRVSTEIVNQQNVTNPTYEANGDFLCDNEDLHDGTTMKRKGRGITKLQDIFSRTPDMPKIPITLNEFGQPVGENSRKLSSAIGCHVRKKLPLGCDDWRLVDAEKKYEIWTDIKAIYDLDAAAFNWFMSTSGRKWKDFKARLKAKYFDEALTDEELKKRNGDRVNAADWDFLIDYWRSPESQALTTKGKEKRSKVEMLHSSGSVSYACVRHDLGKKLGRTPRRDEVYIKTHTRKNGVPLRQAAPTINKLKAVVEDRPELKDRTIEQGDAFAAICGVKEPKGRVRGLGLGPTPQELGTPGVKSYLPTRFQMEVLARKKAEGEKAALEQRIMEMEQQLQSPQIRRNVEDWSQHGSNSQHHVSPRSEEHVDANHDDQCDDIDNTANNDDCDHYDEDENFLPRHAAAPSAHAGNITTSQRNNDSPRFAHDALVGSDVILYAMRSDTPVAKGTVISTNPKTTVGGEALGKQYCEVVVNVVLKRDAFLPRPYDYMETMAGALKMSIAWPYKKLKVVNKRLESSQIAAGTARRH